MRVLGTSVLVFEWMIFALAIPVAINVAGVAPLSAFIFLGIVTVLVVSAVRALPGRTGIVIGWVVQAVALLSGLVLLPMAILGAMFTGLWFMAVRLGTDADVKAATAKQAAAEGPASQVETAS